MNPFQLELMKISSFSSSTFMHASGPQSANTHPCPDRFSEEGFIDLKNIPMSLCFISIAAFREFCRCDFGGS